MTRLRVATFNLLHGISLPGGHVHEADLRASVEALDADVLGLQEVDRGQPRSHGIDQAAVAAQALGAAHWRFVACVRGTPGDRWTAAAGDDGAAINGPSYGVALVSRLPVQSWHVRRFGAAPLGMPLLVPGQGLVRVPDEPRVGVAAVLHGPDGPLTVATAHLTFVPGPNVRQLRSLTRWLAGFPAPRILLGDFNLPGAIPRWTTGWTQLARAATYPSWRPRIQFDHVLAQDGGRERVREVAVESLAISDHCAVRVDVEL